MATASVTNTFVNGTPADATDVNQNFTDLVSFANNSTLHTDGTKAMSAALDAGSNKIVNLSAGVSDSDAVNVGQLDSFPPVGSVLMWGGATAPSGYLLCQGQAVSRTTYSSLFAIIGTTFGAGDGSTTFNLPDLQGAFPLGKSGSYALGATGGSADQTTLIQHQHADTFAVSNGAASHTHAGPSHTHSGPSHTHALTSGNTNFWRVSGTVSGAATGSIMVFGTYSGRSNIGTEYTDAGGTGNTGASGTASTGAASNTNATHGHGLTGTVGNVSGASTSAGTGANMPPYVGVNFIIRTAV